MTIRLNKQKQDQLIAERNARVQESDPLPNQPESVSPGLNTSYIDEIERSTGAKMTPDNAMDFIRSAYTDDMLKGAGIDPSILRSKENTLMQSKLAKEEAASSLPSTLGVLEDVARTVSGAGQFNPGQSDIAKQLGLGKGFGSITADLALKAQEGRQKYNSFIDNFNGLSSSFQNEYLASAKQYADNLHLYEMQVEQIDNLLAEQRAYERQVELIKIQNDAQKELESFREGLDRGIGVQKEQIDIKSQLEGKTVSSIFDGPVQVSPGAASDANPDGIDLMANYGTQIKLHKPGTIIYAGPSEKNTLGGKTSGPGWGNQVIVQYEDGTRGAFNHLSEVSTEILQSGQPVEAGFRIGKVGNTGNVLTQQPDGSYGAVTEEQRKQGKGSHLDYTLTDSQGNPLGLAASWRDLTGEEIVSPSGNDSEKLAILTQIKQGQVTPSEVSGFREKAKAEGWLDEFTNSLYGAQQIASDAKLRDVLESSRGTKELNGTQITSIEKTLQAIDGIQDLQEIIEGVSTGPIIGLLKSKNPYDDTARQIKAKLTSIIPNLARGVYGEVGVLTDNDVRLYQQTLPNLTSTADQQKLILDMTLRSIQRGLETKLQTYARSGRDVSNFTNILDQLESMQEGSYLESENQKEFSGSTIEDAQKFLEDNGISDYTDEDIQFVLNAS